MSKKQIATLLMLVTFLAPTISLAQSQQTREQLINRIQTLIAFVKVLQAQLSGNAVPSGNCVGITNNLSYYSRDRTTNNEVSKLQRFLRDEGIYPPDLITGFFGPATESSVKRFQVDNDVISFGSPETTGYGVAGPKTRKAILNNCTKTNTTVANQTPTNNPSNTTNRNPITNNSALSLELKINGSVPASGLGTTVDYKKNFNIAWASTGAQSCSTSGSNMPVVSGISGGSWTGANIGTSGRGVLEASVKRLPISPGVLFVTVDCKSSSGRSTRKSAMLTVKSDPFASNSLTGNASPINIISPNSSTRTAGSRLGISWTTTIDTLEGGSVTARLIPVVATGNLDDTNSHMFVSEEYTKKTGSTFDVIPASIVAGKYLIEVKVTTPEGTKTKKSSEFTVNAAPVFAVADTEVLLTNPKGGERWKEGTERLIMWQGPVKRMQLIKNGSVVTQIGGDDWDVSSFGAYTWLVPTGLVGDGYSIQTTSGSSFDGEDVKIGQSGKFNITNVNNSTDGVKPSVPTGLKAIAQAGGVDIDLEWTASTDNVGVTEYWVYRDGNSIGKTSGKTSDLLYKDSGLLQEVAYSYSVRAVDAGGNVSDYSSSINGIIPPPPPSIEILEWPDTNNIATFPRAQKIKWKTKNIEVDTSVGPDIYLVSTDEDLGSHRYNGSRYTKLTYDVSSIVGSGGKSGRTREVVVNFPTSISSDVYYIEVAREIGGKSVSVRSPDLMLSTSFKDLVLVDNFSVNTPLQDAWLQRGKEHTIAFDSSIIGTGMSFKAYLVAPYKNTMMQLTSSNAGIREGLMKAEVKIEADSLSEYNRVFTNTGYQYWADTNDNDDNYWKDFLSYLPKRIMRYKGPYNILVIVYNGNNIVRVGLSREFWAYGEGQNNGLNQIILMGGWDGKSHGIANHGFEIDNTNPNSYCGNLSRNHDYECTRLQNMHIDAIQY